jgi:hypothetical protein
VHSSRKATAAKDRPKFTTAADDLLDLDRGLGEMCRDLVKAHPNIHTHRAPNRGSRESRVGHHRKTHVAAGACLAEQLEEIEDDTVTRMSELGLGWREAVARKKTGRDRDRIAIRAHCRVFDLRRVSKLDRDRVSHDVSKAPLPVPCGVEEAVVSSNQDAHEIAVGGLREIENP